MGRGYTRIIGVKKFWLITALLGLEIVNLQVLGDFLGSGLSAALSVLWIFVVVVIVGSNIEDIMNLLQGRYTLDKQQITERLDEITRQQDELEGKYQATLAGWETKIAEKLVMMANDMPQLAEQIKVEVVKNSEDAKQSMLKALMDFEQGIKEANLLAKEQRDKTLEKISELLGELVNVSKQITELADSDKHQAEELGRKCADILEAVSREVAGLTQQVDTKTGAITQLLEIKSTEMEGRLTAGTDKHAEMLKVSVDAIRQQVMRSDESLVHTINKMQLETEERVKVYKRMVETAFAELTAEFVELEGDARLRHKEVTAQISDNGELLKRAGADTEQAIQKGVDLLTDQIDKQAESSLRNLERIEADMKEKLTDVDTAIQGIQNVSEKQTEAIQKDIAELNKDAGEKLNTTQAKLTDSLAALQKDEAARADTHLAKLDKFNQNVIQCLDVLKESNKDVTAQISDTGELLKRTGADTEQTIQKGIELLTGQIHKLSESSQQSLERIEIDVKDKLIDVNKAIQDSQNDNEMHKMTIQQGITDLKAEALNKLNDVQVNLVDSFAALQKDEETKTKSRLAKFDIAIKDVTQRLNTLRDESEARGKLLESNLETYKAGIKQGWDGFLQAITGDLKQLRQEFSQATQPLNEQLSKVAENVAEVKAISSEQQQMQDDQQDDYRQILAGQEKLQNDFRTMEANISNWQEPWDLLDGMEKRLASLQGIIDTLTTQQQELLTSVGKQQPLPDSLTKKESKKEKKKSKKIQQAEQVTTVKIEEPVVEAVIPEPVGQEPIVDEPISVVDPNRTETIEDKANNSTILREFRDNELYKDMMLVDDKLKHEIYYDVNSKPKRAINYDENEEIRYELEYYPNGEAKKRIEYVTRNGKQDVIVSEFDEKGHKLS